MDVKIDSSMEKEPLVKEKVAKKINKNIIGKILLGFLVFIILFVLSLALLVKYYFSISLSDIKIFLSKENSLYKENRVNVLLLGKGDFDHDGSDLTDTIIFTSLNKETKKVTMVSIPRDVWIPSMKAKINSAYYWGVKEYPENPMYLLNSSVEEVLGKSAPYYAIINFSNFEKIIDSIGGVDVNVENTFTDKKYPIKGKENDLCNGDREYKCRYETITFEKGITHMNGATALKYVRSRNAEGDEGTDIAREKRQQNLIGAIKNKAMSPKYFIENLRNSKKTLDLVLSSIDTNLTRKDLIMLVKGVASKNIVLESHIIEDKFLVHPPVSKKYEMQYVFIPKGDNWKEVHSWVDSIIY